jgi:galactosamine-6-phosphate isomerase
VHLEIAPDYESLSRRAASYVAGALRREPALLLGLATGASPARTYELLAARRRREPGLFRRCRVVGLDEWGGLSATHPASCARYIRDRILRPLGITAARHRHFKGDARDPAAEIRRMARWLHRHGPVGLGLLGLGRNGHLLMNEPASALPPRAHFATLAPSTRRHTMLEGLRSAPRQGLTFGLAEVLQARSLLLLVSGRHKREALARMLQGTVTPRCPASFLWLHPQVTVLADRAATGSLRAGEDT